MSGACPACGAAGLDVFHEKEPVPTNSCLLLASRAEATGYPTGTLRVAFCPACGFVTNTAFDPRLAEYSARYEETQVFSPLFVDWGRELAARWVERHGLEGRTVLEIGCGKGEFLEWMVEAGAGAGIGIDPGVHPERRTSAAAQRITWIADFYSEAYTHLQADAVVCRHTLEHIPDVAAFMRMVRRAIGDRPDTVVLFELPDVLRVLREVAFWDVYYEHCSYFSLGSLARLFRATGFEVLDLEVDYDDQYLLIEARPAATPAPGAPLPVEDDLPALRSGVEGFRTGYARTIDAWRGELARLATTGRRVVVWGAGSKGVAYLTALAGCGIEYAVDVNPHKHGMFIAGTGQEIVAPEFLREYRPDLAIVMNPIYRGEIADRLAGLGVDAEVRSVTDEPVAAGR